MCRHKLIILISIIMAASELMLGQKSVFLVGNGDLMRVFVRDTVQNEKFEASVLLKRIYADTLTLRVEFEDLTTFEQQVYLLEKGKPVDRAGFVFKVSKDKKDIRYLTTHPAGTEDPDIVPGPAAKDTLKKKNPYDGLCELKKGQVIFFNNLRADSGCVKPMPATYTGYGVKIVSTMRSQDEKYRVLEDLCRFNCLSTDQLLVLMGALEYELDKLRLIKSAYFHLTDTVNRSKLAKGLRFDASVKELNNFFKNPGAHKTPSPGKCATPSPDEKITEFTAQLALHNNDSQRLEVFRKLYPPLCFTTEHAGAVLKQFIHDREKLQAARLMYFNCTNPDRFSELGPFFSYKQSASELEEFIHKQQR